MLSVLRDRTYRHLFAAQVLSLIGTGLATVALGLLAYAPPSASARGREARPPRRHRRASSSLADALGT